jgi:site-specific DNA-methyltransferase (adenine-specific)
MRIIHADALTALADIPDASIDMVFTDPPYGHNNNNGDLIHRREAALGRLPCGENPPLDRKIMNDGPEANDLFRSVLPELFRVLKPGSCCCCCCGGGGGPDPQFARWSLWMDEVFDFKQMVVWDKGPMGMGWHYRRSYEVVLVGQKPGAACKWYDTTNAVENIIRGVNKIIPRGHQHPTSKPVALAAHFIKLHSQPGEVVLDPFCGGGSTLEAARGLGRKSIGIDLDPEHIATCRARARKTGLMAYTPEEAPE